MANENQKPIENPQLLEAIANMRKDFNQDTQNVVINQALRSTFLVPAVINKNTQLVADADNKVKFEDKPQAKFLLITHKEKGTFFPVFTDSESLKTFKTEQEFRGFAMKFGDIAALTEKTPNVEGFIINPMTQNLPFTKPMLESIKATLQKVREAAKAKAEADGAPNITVSTNDAE